jgi:hypothetical protein
MKIIAVIRQEQWVMEYLYFCSKWFYRKVNWFIWKSLDKGMATIAANLDRMISKEPLHKKTKQ